MRPMPDPAVPPLAPTERHAVPVLDAPPIFRAAGHALERIKDKRRHRPVDGVPVHANSSSREAASLEAALASRSHTRSAAGPGSPASQAHPNERPERRSADRSRQADAKPCPICGGVAQFWDRVLARGADLEPGWVCRNPRCDYREFVRHPAVQHRSRNC